MRDIDLIPHDYLALRRLRRRLAWFAAVIVVVLGATAAARLAVWLRIEAARSALEQVRRQGQSAAEEGARLAALRAAKAAGDLQLATLRTLLDATAPEALWRGIDAAYHDRIWLDSVTYARSVRASAVATAAATAPGAAVEALAATPVFEHDAELRGHGLDHAAVTDFMRALGERPGIGAVRLADSTLRPYAAIEVVAFSVAVKLGARAGDGR